MQLYKIKITLLNYIVYCIFNQIGLSSRSFELGIVVNFMLYLTPWFNKSVVASSIMSTFLLLLQ